MSAGEPASAWLPLGTCEELPQLQHSWREELWRLLEFSRQHLFLRGGPVRHCFTLEMGKGHLSNRWTRTYVNDPMEPEASEVLQRLWVHWSRRRPQRFSHPETGSAPLEEESPGCSRGSVQRRSEHWLSSYSPRLKRQALKRSRLH